MNVIITGWQEGFRKISMTKLIRAYAGYGLARGKQDVNAILAGELVVIPGFAREQAASFVSAAQMLGAVCHLAVGDAVLTI